MAKYILLFFGSLIIYGVNAQKADFKVIYNYERTPRVAPVYQGVSYLYFNKTQSLHVFPQKEEVNPLVNNIDNHGQGIVVSTPDKEQDAVFTDIEKGIQIFKESPRHKSFIITDSLINMEWELLKIEKVVNGIQCLKATGHYAGRDYVAWYAPRFPFPFGPIRFQGLPGIIVKLFSTDKEVRINLVSIEELSADYGKILSPPVDGVKVDWHKYVKLMFDEFDQNYMDPKFLEFAYKIHLKSGPIEKAGKYDIFCRYYKHRHQQD